MYVGRRHFLISVFMQEYKCEQPWLYKYEALKNNWNAVEVTWSLKALQEMTVDVLTRDNVFFCMLKADAFQ